MIFVIGGRGRLGGAIHALYQDHEAVSLRREIYQDWWRDNSPAAISRFFEPYVESNPIVFVTAGVLDPKLTAEEHLRVNYLLPKHIIEGAIPVGARVVTFGTIMERIITGDRNPYVRSKAALGAYVSDMTAGNDRVAHLRVHTLYGAGAPSPFMFLGQIYQALTDNAVFEMSPGNQLREYHHLDDEVRAIRAVVDAKVHGVFDISHGEPVSLKELARHVFSSFNAEPLLRIGALPEPREENYTAVFERPELLKNVRFRPTLPAVVDYLAALSPKMEKRA